MDHAWNQTYSARANGGGLERPKQGSVTVGQVLLSVIFKRLPEASSEAKAQVRCSDAAKDDFFIPFDPSNQGFGECLTYPGDPILSHTH